jgi:tRNA threonylcarbamoyl adenosine modification protein YeaZ
VLVLAIDTSSPAVTAALVTADGEVLASRTDIAPRGHGELLAPSVAACLDEAGVAVGAVEAVAVGTGPGPYTGLRVGLVTAAAFADARGIPAYGACSLDAIAASCTADGNLLVVTDARRREVYWARYERGVRVSGPHVDHPADVPLDDVTAIAGAAVDLYEWRGPRVLAPRYPEPGPLVRLALASGADSAPLAPLYLRRPDAVVPGAPKPVSR